MSPNFVAEMLERGARAYASYAAARLFDTASRPPVGPAGFLDWQDQLTQMVHDLAAAVRVGEPTVFASQVSWLRGAFEARSVPTGALVGALEALGAALDEELPEPAKPTAAPFLRAGLEAARRAGAGERPALSPDTPEGRLGLEYLARLLGGDRRGARDVALSAFDRGTPIRSLYLRTLVPALEEIGRMWHVGEASVAEEHFATDTTQGVMAILCSRATPAPANGKSVIVAAAPGNTHDIAVRVAADLFELDGWRSICVGADVPSADLASACAAFSPDLIALSAMMPGQLRTTAEAIGAIHAMPDQRARTLVGGRAFASSPDLWRRVGADAYAPTVEEACGVGRRLVGLASE
ncbi:MAG: cobalamin B12-binding domain-containing protein [Phycisphaerales bacterium]|nr:cobalamin B12-binding domain-containing protein [Phycisphaerales bacterium]